MQAWQGNVQRGMWRAYVEVIVTLYNASIQYVCEYKGSAPACQPGIYVIVRYAGRALHDAVNLHALARTLYSAFPTSFLKFMASGIRPTGGAFELK